jgi:hypothetical protein
MREVTDSSPRGIRIRCEANMDGSALSRARRLLSQLPSLRQVVQAGSEHRHLVLGAGVLLVVAAVWIGVQDGREAEVEGDVESFAELDGFDVPPAPLIRLPEQREPLVLPTAMPADETPFDLGPTFASGQPARAAINAMHVVSQTAEPAISAAPAWLTGTIEALDDESPVPQAWAFPDSEIRYVRPARR